MYKDTWFYCLNEKKGVKSTCFMLFLVENLFREQKSRKKV